MWSERAEMARKREVWKQTEEKSSDARHLIVYPRTKRGRGRGRQLIQVCLAYLPRKKPQEGFFLAGSVTYLPSPNFSFSVEVRAALDAEAESGARERALGVRPPEVKRFYPPSIPLCHGALLSRCLGSRVFRRAGLGPAAPTCAGQMSNGR